MSQFRFVHAADIHLDSPLVGLENYGDVPSERIRMATREAFRALVDLCLEQEAKFLLISGDLYDGSWKSASTGYFFAKEIARLTEAPSPVPVYLIKGNHDAASLLIRDMKVPNLHLFSHKRPQSIRVPGVDVVIHGQSFRDHRVEENLARGYPKAEQGLLNIGMLHTSAGGASDHDTYAPCDPAELAAMRYDYWALGHIHKRQELHVDPHIVFPGNLQGRHIREEDPAGKGCTVVTVKNREVIEVAHHSLDVVRWARVDADVSGAKNPEEALGKVRERLLSTVRLHKGRLVCCRLTVHGNCPASRDLHKDHHGFVTDLRAMASGMREGEVWLEQVALRTTRKRGIEEAVEGDGYVPDLLRFVRRAGMSKEIMDILLAESNLLKTRIARDAPQLNEELKLDDPQTLADLLGQVEETLLGLLEEGE